MAAIYGVIIVTRGAKRFFRLENSFHKYEAGCMQTYLQKFAHVVEKAVWENLKNRKNLGKSQKWRKQAILIIIKSPHIHVHYNIKYMKFQDISSC